MYRKNSRKTQYHFPVRKGFVLMVVVGILGLNTSMSMGLISEDRKDVIQGHAEKGRPLLKERSQGCRVNLQGKIFLK